MAELFSQGPRAAAVNIGVLVNWLANFVVGLSFPFLESSLETLVFLPYTCLLAFFIVFLYYTLPETKGKTFEEISALFGANKNNMALSPERVDDDIKGVPGNYSSFSSTDAATVQESKFQ